MLKEPIENIASHALRMLFVLASIGIVATNASALDLTGGPAASPPGGGGCTTSGMLGGNTGVTLTCTVSSPGNFVDLYFGIVNNKTVNGMAMDGSAPSGFAVFRYSSHTASSIIYTSTTSLEDTGTATDASTRLIMTVTSGSATVEDVGGTPANNGNGDIDKLFRIAGDKFTIQVEIDSNTAAKPVFAAANTGIYDSTQTSPDTRTQTKLDVGFYYNECTP